jgi:HlyD family secretion protein
MDVQRANVASRKKKKKLVSIAIAAVVLLGLLLIALNLKPAAPSVDRNTVWIGEVKRGPLQLKVRGIGTFVPEDQRWITAQTSGTIKQIILLPGAQVKPDSVIMELSNPELEQDMRRAELQLASAEAQLANQRVREEDALLEMEYQLAQLEASLENARLDERVNAELFEEGLIAERDLLRSRVARDQLERQFEILGQRLATRKEQMEQNLAPAISAVEQEKERVTLLKQQVEDLKVKAGINGILQRLPLQDGQQVSTGTQLAQVADPSRLKAVIRVPETQAKDIQIGQPALIDNRNGTVTGTVARIDPAVEGGQVNVDVRLSDELPPGARADQTVEGQIELESLNDVIYVGRPAFGRENSTAGIFVVQADGSTALRTTVAFGRSSVSEIEVREGLRPGDRVILSDTSQWDEQTRIKLN